MSADYFVILIRRDIDQFSHNDLFAAEIAAAFAARDWSSQTLDCIAQGSEVFAALKDPRCKFFVSFNGFGTELKLPAAAPGQLVSAFEFFGKRVFDLMHDCPAHEAMRHQVSATHAKRILLCTDYDYAGLAVEFGVRNVQFAATITFPASIEAAESRDIDVLLGSSLASATLFGRERLDSSRAKGKLFQSVFDDVVERCRADLSVNPLTELRHALSEVGLRLDVKDRDMRFLLTLILDFVKFERRQEVLNALPDVPITLVTDRDISDLPSNFTALPMCSARELLNLMSRAKVVICPPVHSNGFHERPMSAFTAGAVVVSAPNGPLQSYFSHGEDILFFKRPDSVGEQVETALRRPGLGVRGQQKALSLFSPGRLADTILNSMID